MSNGNAVATIPEMPVEKGLIMPKSFSQMWYLAEVYSKSGMVPKAYTNNAAAIVVAGQFGAQLGMDLLPSLQNIANVNGNPSLWGDAVKALVQQTGTLEIFVEYFTGTYPQDDFTAVCIAKRKDQGLKYDPNLSLDDLRKRGIYVSEFSVADAKKARLWGGTGSDEGKRKSSVWFKYDKRMIKMRARAFTLRDGWPDTLKGLRVAEEMQGIESDGDMTETAPGKFEMPKYDDTPDKIAKFDELSKDYPKSQIEKFITLTAKTIDVPVEDFKVAAANDFEKFSASFEKWNAKNPADPETVEPEIVEPSEKTTVDDDQDEEPKPMSLAQFKKIKASADESFSDEEITKVIEWYAKENGGKTHANGETLIKDWDSILDDYMEATAG